MNPILPPTVELSLTAKPATAALDFYVRAFGAKELLRVPMPNGALAHCEFKIGTTKIMMSDEAPDRNARAMPEGAMASCLFGIWVEDCDAAFARAVEAGATSLIEPITEFWGVRVAMVKDPFGYRWAFRQRIEEITPEEMMERAKKFGQQKAAQAA